MAAAAHADGTRTPPLGLVAQRLEGSRQGQTVEGLFLFAWPRPAKRPREPVVSL